MTKKAQKELENFLKRVTNFETLETRHSDSLDFHTISVWTLKEALELAYDLGKETKWKSRKAQGKETGQEPFSSLYEKFWWQHGNGCFFIAVLQVFYTQLACKITQ